LASLDGPGYRAAIFDAGAQSGENLSLADAIYKSMRADERIHECSEGLAAPVAQQQEILLVDRPHVLKSTRSDPILHLLWQEISTARASG
jgi:hypothetical protein